MDTSLLSRPALTRLAAGDLLGYLPPARGDFMSWAEERAEAVIAAYRTRSLSGPRWIEDALAAAEKGVAPYAVDQGVALIGVQGLIVPQLEVIGWSWATGCAELCWQLEHAASNDQVRGIVLLTDSPGGYVLGVDEAAASIRAARQSKPVLAAVQGMAFSAAYWLASSADQISAPRMAGVGHIGTMATHYDLSNMLERAGVIPTILHSGARKIEGHPYVPLSETARADIQSRLDAIRQVFAQSVADGRRNQISVASILATEARAFDGPQGIADALKAGLIDAVLPAQEAISLFVDHLAGESG